MSSIDLSKLVNVDGKNMASGLVSGLDTKSLINSLLEPQLEVIRVVEEDSTQLSNVAQAFSDLQNYLSTLKDAFDSPSGIRSALTARTAVVKGREADQYLQVTADLNSELQSFNLDNIEIAIAKQMTSSKFLNSSKLPDNFTELLISPITPTATVAVADISSDLGTEFFNGNSGFLGQKALQNASFLDDFLKNDGGIINVEIDTKKADKAVISFWKNNHKYESAPIDMRNGKIVANSELNFFSQSNDVYFKLITQNVDININSNFDKQLACTKIAADFANLDIIVNKHIENIKPNGLLAHLRQHDIAFTAGDMDNLSYFSPFKVTAAEQYDGASISITINGEVFITKGLGNKISKLLVLNSVHTGNSLTIDLKDKEIFIGDDSSADLLEKSLNELLDLKTGTKLAVNKNETLYSIAARINNQMDNISAKVLQVSDNDFRLVIESKDTGRANDFVINGCDFTCRNARDASFNFSGVTVTRSINYIDDLVAKVSINLLEDAPQQHFTIETVVDQKGIERAVNTFVDAYNQLQLFAIKQLEIDRNGEFVDGAVLHGNYILDSICSKLADVIHANYNNSEKFRNIAEIGLAVQTALYGKQKYNILHFDGTKFATAMQKDRILVLNLISEFAKHMSETISSEAGRKSLMHKELANLAKQSSRNISRQEFLTEKLERSREKLIERYSALERQIMHANSVIDMLKSQQDAYNAIR